MPTEPDPKLERAAELQKVLEQHERQKEADAEALGTKLDKYLSAMDAYLKKADEMARRMDMLETDARKRGDIKRKRKADDDDGKDEKDEKDDDGELRVEHGDGRDGGDDEGFAEQPTGDPEDTLAKRTVADRRRSNSSMSRADAERRREHRLAEI